MIFTFDITRCDINEPSCEKDDIKFNKFIKSFYIVVAEKYSLTNFGEVHGNPIIKAINFIRVV